MEYEGQSGLRRLAPTSAGLAVLAVGIAAWPYSVDDAYIVARYATRLVAGLGYTFTGSVATDGVTGPLWLLPGLAAALVGADPVVAAKVVGLLAMAGAATLVVRHLGRRAGGRASVPAALSLCALAPSFGCWGVAGLETGAATLAACTAALFVSGGSPPRPHALGIVLGLCAWLRPELLPYLGISALIAVARSGRAAWPTLAWTAVGVTALCVFRATLFGSVLPLSYHAKAGGLFDGLRYTVRSLLGLTGGTGAVLAAIGAIRGRGSDRVLALLACTHVLSVVLAGGDWMPGFRLLLPILPLYVVLAATGFSRLQRRARARALAWVLLVPACAVPALDLITRLPELRGAGRTRDSAGAALAAALRESAKRVALVDIGYLAYASGCDVLDLGAVTDPRVAALPGGHLAKRVPESLLRASGVDALLLHSSIEPRVARDGTLLALAGYPVERRVARMHFVRSEFRVARVVRYAPRYFYVLLRRVPP